MNQNLESSKLKGALGGLRQRQGKPFRKSTTGNTMLEIKRSSMPDETETSYYETLSSEASKQLDSQPVVNMTLERQSKSLITHLVALSKEVVNSASKKEDMDNVKAACKCANSAYNLLRLAFDMEKHGMMTGKIMVVEK